MFSLAETGKEFKLSLRLAIPLILSEIIYALSGFLATAMIAHLGKEQLATHALVWQIYMTTILFFIGVLCSISIMASQSFGTEDKEATIISFKQGIIIALIFSVPMMVIMGSAPQFLSWTKQDPTVISLSKSYCYSMILPMIPLNIWVAIQQFLMGINRVRIVAITNAIAVPIELFFFYVFIFGKLGFPQLGLAGIGFGLTASFTVVSIFLIAYLQIEKDIKNYHLFQRWWIIERKFFMEMFRIGVPMGIMWFSEVTFFTIVALMMGVLGVNVLAAFQIADQYLMIAVVILFALGQTAVIRIGNEVGRNNKDQIKLSAVINIVIAIFIIGCFSAFYLIFPEVAIRLDIDVNASQYSEVMTETLKYFPLVAILLLVDCIRIVLNGALRGLKDTNFQLILSVLGYWVIAFPLAYLLGFKYNLGGIGIWWGIIIGLFTNGIMLIFRFRKLLPKLDLSSLITKK